MDYTHFTAAFQEAHNLVQGDAISFLEYRNLGDLVITSGKLIACDPWFAGEDAYFSETVSPGQYPVIVAIAHISNADQRIAFAAVLFHERQIVKWQNASFTGVEVTAGKLHCYGVDSGTGCFMDADAVRAFSTLCDESKMSEDPLMIEIEKPEHYVHTSSWANCCVDQETGSNIIAFSSGWGDGGYPSYFGYTEDGEIACLITEFGVFDEQEK